jgi:hypothetical protein
MSEALASVVATGSILMAAKEAGAGALLATIAAAGANPRITVVAEAPADHYFAAKGLRVSPVERDRSGFRFERLFAAHPPDRVVTGASAGRTIEKDLLDAAAKRGVPSLAVVDHYWNLWQRFAGDTPRDRWRYRPDAIWVPSPLCRDRLVALNCPVRDIHVFEHPLLVPEGTARSAAARERTRAQLGWARTDTVVLFVSEYGFDDAALWQWDQPPEADIEALGLELLAVAERLSRQGQTVRLLVRPHPAEQRDWSKLLPRSSLVAIDRALEKADVFAVADIAFGLNSMLLAEAVASGVPAFARYPSGTYRGAKLSDFRKDVIELDSAPEVEAAIRARMG